MPEFALAPGLDVARLSAIFAANKRLQIADFLEPRSAEGLFRELASSRAWRLAANKGEQVLDFDPAAIAGWSAEQRAKFGEAVTLGGRFGFQFLYETIRIKKGEEKAAGSGALGELAEFLSSPPLIAMLREITGADDIDFADAHASRYRPGHFLSTHDDRVDEMGRRAAYVLNLTPRWRIDWGGLLLFHDAQGNIVRGFTPGFNVLTLFAVPQPHSVSMVTALAPEARYAVTGWLRAAKA